jgi:predicted ester cyclase
VSSETYRELARCFFIEQDRLRGGPAPELCAPGYTAHLPGSPAFDLAGHQTFAAAFYGGFPDLRHSIEQVIVEGERAAVRFTLLGTHTGPFLGLMPTGRSIAVTANVCLALEGEHVAELWGEFDQLGLMRQLTGEGVAPILEDARGI